MFTVLLDREFIFMPLCDVLKLLFDHLKDVTTTPETLRVLRHQRCRRPPCSTKDQNEHEEKVTLVSLCPAPEGSPNKRQPHRGLRACYHQEDFLRSHYPETDSGGSCISSAVGPWEEGCRLS